MMRWPWFKTSTWRTICPTWTTHTTLWYRSSALQLTSQSSKWWLTSETDKQVQATEWLRREGRPLQRVATTTLLLATSQRPLLSIQIIREMKRALPIMQLQSMLLLERNRPCLARTHCLAWFRWMTLKGYATRFTRRYATKLMKIRLQKKMKIIQLKLPMHLATLFKQMR